MAKLLEHFYNILMRMRASIELSEAKIEDKLRGQYGVHHPLADWNLIREGDERLQIILKP